MSVVENTFELKLETFISGVLIMICEQKQGDHFLYLACSHLY